MTVLITGASGGLGRAMAIECAGRGYDLFLTDLSERGLQEIRQGILRQFDVKVYSKACDLTDENAVADLFTTIDDLNLKLNMFLGIAGIDFEGGFTKRECSETIGIVEVNVISTMRVTHAALAQRDKSEKFNVVIVSSLASQYPMPLKATYAASKRFLLDFSIALRQELRKENVDILALCPSGLATTNETIDAIVAQGFMGRISTVDLSVVAHKTISKALAGKAQYVPGTVNRLLSALGKLLPKNMIAKILFNRWESAQKKWLQIET